MKETKVKPIKFLAVLRTVPLYAWIILIILSAMIYTVNFPQILEPVLSFLLAGVVPGTDIVIAPDIIIIGVIVAAIILFGSLVLSSIVHTFDVRRVMKANAAEASAPAETLAEQVPELAVAMAATAQADMPVEFQETETVHVPQDAAAAEEVMDAPGPIKSNRLLWLKNFFVAMDRAMQSVMVAVYQASSIVIAKVLMWAIQLKPVLVSAGKLLQRYSMITLRLLHRAGIWLAHKFAAMHPYALKLDGWLEIQYRAVTGFIVRFLMRFESVQIIAQVVRESMNNLRQLFKLPK